MKKIIWGLVLGIFLICVNNVSAGTLYVGTSQNYTTIQSAINNASNGDTIYVYNGTYTEQVVVNKSVTIEGQDLYNTFVHGGFNVTFDNVIIHKFNISQGYNISGDFVGIYVNSNNNDFYDNHIWNITGDDGEDAGDASNNPGGSATGIYLAASSSSNTVYNNIINNLTGGQGGDSSYNLKNGGMGGFASGIYSSSPSSNISSNRISNVRGGKGGRGGYQTSNDAGVPGRGGIGTGIYLSSNTNHITSNNISAIWGGKGGNGPFASPGGNGGIGSGIYLSSSILNDIMSNNMAYIDGGEGGLPGAYGAPGLKQRGFGIYLDTDSLNNNLGSPISGYNTLDGDYVVYHYNQQDLVINNFDITANSNPTNYGKMVFINSSNVTISNNNISNFVGEYGLVGNPNAHGTPGKMGSGIYLKNSDAVVNNNNISNIIGGRAGLGGTDADWWESICNQYGATGGKGVGIYVYSTSGIITDNTIENITGGEGEKRGTGAGSGGHGGVGSGIYLELSSSSDVSGNTITDITGGHGHISINCWTAEHSRHGNGGNATGVYLLTSTSNSITDNSISLLTAGETDPPQQWGGGFNGTEHIIFPNPISNIEPTTSGQQINRGEIYSINWTKENNNYGNFGIYYDDTRGEADNVINTSITLTEANCDTDLNCRYDWDTTDVAFGSYYIFINESNNASSNSTYSLAVEDTINPIPVIVIPENKTYLNYYPELNFSYEENYPDSCWYSLNDDPNITLASCDTNGTILPSNQGSNKVTLYMNDTSDNMGSSTVYFTTYFCTDNDEDGYGIGDERTACTYPEEDCNDTNPGVHPGATEICNGIDDDCDNQTDEGYLTVKAEKKDKTPIAGMEVRAFNKSGDSCAQSIGISLQNYGEIWSNCTEQNSCFTDYNGTCIMELTEEGYVVIGEYIENSNITYTGSIVGYLGCGQERQTTLRI